MKPFGCLLCCLLVIVPPAEATAVKIFRANEAKVFLEGDLEGIGLDRLGRLQLADPADKLAAVAEPFLQSAALGTEGWVVGTGSSGRVFRVTADGEVNLVLEAPEPEVFAVLADPDGTVYVGTSPRGKVYRVRPGGDPEAPEVFFDPGETYIWALDRAGDGRLLVATGTQGKLYAVGADGKGSVLYDSHDTHLRSLVSLPGGDALVGTAGEGLIVRIDGRGQARTLYDAPQPEIVALTAGKDGRLYAAAVASEASQVDLGKTASESKEDKDDGEDDEESGGDESSFAGIGSRPESFSGARSEILEIDAQGLVEIIWRFQQETVYSLLWQQDRLWIATGQEGKIYTFRGGSVVLETDTPEAQVVALMASQPGPSFATTNGAAVYRLRQEGARQGTYQSKVLDASQLGRFGSFRWRGDVPEGTSARFSVRTGMSSEPDATWSSWTPPSSDEEIDLAALPPGRFAQWRVVMSSTVKATPQVAAVEISYQAQNLRPRVDSLEVLEPGQILVPSNFNPTNQAFEPAHPNRDGIFTTLSTDGGRGEGRVKTLWKLGYLSLRWDVSDPNDDALRSALYVQPGEEDRGQWLLMAKDLRDEYYSFDATALPDGLYRFRLEVTDEEANAGDRGLSAEKLTEVVVIDHTAPQLGKARRQDDRLEVTVQDELNPLRELVFSVDAGPWKPLRTADGLVDGRSETVLLSIPDDVPEKTRYLLLRATDAAHNVRTFDLSGELR